MFINDKLIYLQLQKTACTHIARLLSSWMPGKEVHKHSPLSSDPGRRMIVGSIRNPWDWYVSLWAFGCQQQGAIRNRLVAPVPASMIHILRRNIVHPGKWLQSVRHISLLARKDPAFWQALYASSDDPALFRQWLRNIFTEQGKLLQPGAYPFLPMNRFAGLMTFRFMRLFVDYRAWKSGAAEIRNPSDLEAFYQRNRIVERFIRMESLDRDIASLLQSLGVDVEEADLKQQKTNISKRRGAGFYYDEETVELVRSQEQFIIAQFEYEPP